MTVLLAAAGLAAPFVARAQQPNASWGDGSLLIATFEDCFGPQSQTNAAEAAPCQSYNADLYESLDYTGDNPEPADDTDIRTFNVGADADFLYVAWVLAAPWDPETSPGHQYIIEIDVDPSIEPRGDAYVAIYGKTEFDSVSWVDAQREGGFEAYADNDDSGAANDVGGTNPGTGDPSCEDCPASDPNDQDGYTGKICDADDRIYARIADGVVQLAVRWTCLKDSGNDDLGGRPGAFRVRGWSSQSSTVEKDKLYWHDENLPADLAGENFDNTIWLATGLANPTPTHTGTPVPTSTRGPQGSCVGDCDDSGIPDISDLVLGVNIALGRTPVSACSAFDANANGRVEVNELVRAVINALQGC